MDIKETDLRQILLLPQILTDQQFDLAVKSSKAQGISLHKYLIESNLIKDSDLGQLIANFLNLPYIDLMHVSISDEVIKLIPEETARKKKVVCFENNESGVHIATPNPEDIQIVDFLRKRFNKKIFVHYTTERNIHDALNFYARDMTVAFEDILAENIQKAQKGESSIIEPPIIRIVDTIIEYGYKNKASDIHLEPSDIYSLLRFRIDGMLKDVVKLPKDIHERLVTRIKVMSELRTDMKQAPQDGKIRIRINDDPLNLRVSIVPIIYGEKVVLRVLAEKNKSLNLSMLGFQDESLKRIVSAYKKPYGMILATGPTGSGKTTTLYSTLKELNSRDVNIMTIENPVEYEIDGISQIQVNSKTGLTFASGLRSIVRQDPDIILVGEIRDEETAKIAINSAMTGHLVLSTLHTNDAATTFPRLMDMGVEPFLIASSTNVVVGQRLVRRICEQCRVSKDLSKETWEEYAKIIPDQLLKKIFGAKDVRVYFGKGCDICNHTGYVGRVGIYEVLEVSENIRRAIVTKANSDQIADIAIKEGMITMIEDGLIKVKSGLTSIEEVIRVTKE